VGSVDLELVLLSIAAMLSPTTLTFSVLSLVLAKRPLRTGIWFYLGAFTVTIVIGVIAAFVLGDIAAPSSNGQRKTWVSVFDLVAGGVLLVYVARTWRRPIGEKTTKGMVEKMSSVASSPWIAVFAAGATLANPGGFIPLALKAISELNPTKGQYVAEWVAFTLVSLLPLAIAIVMLNVAHDGTQRVLGRSRGWLQRHVREIGAAIMVVLAASLLRGGVAGLNG